MNGDSTDVAIVGAGIAGLQCALTLSELRPELYIVLLESQSKVGGSANWSVGSFTAGGTRWQSAEGISDSAADHYQDLLKMCEINDPAYRAALWAMCESAPRTLEELEARGVVFAGPFLEPPHTKPRMHNAVPSALSVAQALADRLTETAGADVRTNWNLSAIARRQNGQYNLSGASGSLVTPVVVIASGDCSATHTTVPSMNPGSQGEPIRLVMSGLRAGGEPNPALCPGLRTSIGAGPFIAPSDEIVRQGWIISGETRTQGKGFLAQQEAFAGSELYLELPASIRAANPVVCTYPAIGYARVADLERDGLARKEGDALLIGPMRVVITLADGALSVDERMQVRSVDGYPVPSLFACGSAALGSTVVGGHGHHLLWAATSGSVAAHSIANSHTKG